MHVKIGMLIDNSLTDLMLLIEFFFVGWFVVDFDISTKKTTITDSVLVMIDYTNSAVHQMSYFIRSQQHHYAVHVVRMPLSRSLKMLMFNDDYYTKKGRPSKTLLDLVAEYQNINLNQYCSLALSKKSERSR